MPGFSGVGRGRHRGSLSQPRRATKIWGHVRQAETSGLADMRCCHADTEGPGLGPLCGLLGSGAGAVSQSSYRVYTANSLIAV